MKKKIMIFALCLVPILCTACSINQDKTDTEKESLKSIASDGIELTQDIPCCPLVTDSEKFTPVLEDQSFQFGIDYNTNMDTYYGLAKTPDNFYLSYGGYLYYADGDMNSYGLLCGKPDCDHTDPSVCSAALFDGRGLAFYDNALYTLDELGLKMIKISLDGSQREKACSICGIPEDEIDKGDGKLGYSSDWIIHKGYVYYRYRYYAGMTADSYYMNGSNYIWRTALDGSSEPECLMKLVCESVSEYVRMQAYGSYVYFNVPEKDKTGGFLYRYNIEADEMELLRDLGNDVVGYTIKDGKIYYSNESNPKEIYCYDSESREKEVFLNVTEDKNMPFSWIRSDKDYMYIGYHPKTGEEGYWAGMLAYDWAGNLVVDIPWASVQEEKFGYTELFCGTDEKRLYFSRHSFIASGQDNPVGLPFDSYTSMCYIEKLDMADGKYEMHEIIRH